MKLANQIEKGEIRKLFTHNNRRQNEHKWLKRIIIRAWRRWSKRNLDEDSLNPKYKRYLGWQF